MQPGMRVRGGVVMAVIVVMVMRMGMIMIVTMVMIIGCNCNHFTGVGVSYSGFSVIGATASYTHFNKPPSL
jgi:hypothetical protein